MTATYFRRFVTTAAKALAAVAPIQIVKTTRIQQGQGQGEKSQFTLDEVALRKVLNKGDTQNLPVVVISIAGDFRKGKSFMLNFFVRFLQAKSKGKDNWLEWDANNNTPENNRPLEGFPWKCGCEGHTSGVLLWPEVFKLKNRANQDVAVILMDTQGTFDNEKSDKECATVFALSTMLSSVQIFNLTTNIQKNDLQYLELFVSYGMQAMKETASKPFQTLYFLIRDWSFPHDYAYGKEGGQQLVDKRIPTTSGEETEISLLTTKIRKCFRTISCFLMPHPGKVVATSPDFKGSLAVIDPEFLEHVSKFVEDVLSPENLKPKLISNNKLRTKELINYFKSYLEVFNGDQLPQIQSITKANADANLACALGKAEDSYNAQIAEIFNYRNYPRLKEKVLVAKHAEAKDEAVKQFESAKHFGDKNSIEKVKTDLIKKIDEALSNHKLKLDSESIKQHQAALSKAVDMYNKDMNEKFPRSNGYVWRSKLKKEREKIKSNALHQFRTTPKWGEDKYESKYYRELEKKIEDVTSEIEGANDKDWSNWYYIYPNYWRHG